MFLQKRKKIALALGGGSARGYANIGVLKVFEEENIPVHLLISSSMGAIVAASYSLGKTAIQLEEFAKKITWRDIADMTISRVALTKGYKLEGIIYELIGNNGFEGCRIPLAITTTDIQTGDEILYTEGNLKKIIKASCSWPGFFPPVEIDGRILGDGGIKNSIPAKWGKYLNADFVIAVKVGFGIQHITGNNIFENLVQSFQILGEELDKSQAMNSDFIIEPDIRGINQFDFHKAEYIIRKGELAAREIIPALKRKLRFGF